MPELPAEYAKLKVAELRTECQQRQLSTSGKRDELAARLAEALAAEAVPAEENEEEFVGCFCGSNHKEPTAGFWAGCDGCDRWCHGECTEYKSEAELPEQYFCIVCQAKGIGGRKRKREEESAPVAGGSSDPIDDEGALTDAQRKTRDQDGFVAVPMTSTSEPAGWRALERLLVTDGSQLGRGRDASKGSYDALRLSCAWRLHNPELRKRYEAGVQSVEQQMARIASQGRKLSRAAQQAVQAATKHAASSLPGAPLRDGVNEQLLMHGTNPNVLLSLLSTGLNERLAGTNAGVAFGNGSYLAEDVGKSDQYVAVDRAHSKGGGGAAELHRRLYGNAGDAGKHSGEVFYVLLCRAAMGHAVRTQVCGDAWGGVPRAAAPRRHAWRNAGIPAEANSRRPPDCAARRPLPHHQQTSPHHQQTPPHHQQTPPHHHQTSPHHQQTSPHHVATALPALRSPPRLQECGEHAKSMDSGERVFPISFRELAPVKGVNPPIFHHSLLAEKGASVVRRRDFESGPRTVARRCPPLPAAA